jgi:hypothetical protein
MQNNSLLINRQMLTTFMQFIKKEYYTSSTYDMAFLAMIKKINDIDYSLEKDFIMKNRSAALWILDFQDYFLSYVEKQKKAKEKYWINVFNKKTREGEEFKWTVSEKMNSFKMDTAVLSKDICLTLCKLILNSNPFLDERDMLSHLFLKICSYVFNEDDLFLNDSALNFNYNNVSTVYFLHLKKTIDICSNSYKTKIEKSKSKKDNK